MTRRLLILGASIYQIDAITIAKKLGLEVLTADNNLRNPGHAFSDRAYEISTIDTNEILKLAQREKIDGVIAPCSDASLLSAAVITRNLNLPGATPEVVDILCHKGRFRIFQRRHCLPHPDFQIMGPEWDHAACTPLPGPWVAKPCQGSGGRGVRILYNWDEARAAGLAASQASLDKNWVLERHLTGNHYTLEGIVEEGEIRWAVLTKRTAAPLPFAATVGHEIEKDPNLLERASRCVELCLSLVGYRCGVFDADLIDSNNDFVVLEATPRLGGNCLSRLIKVAAGVDLTELAVRFSIGEFGMPALPSVTQLTPAYVRLITSESGGTLHYNEQRLKEVRQVKDIVEAEIDHPSGSQVPPFRSGRDRIGHSIGFTSERRSAESVHIDFLRFVDYSIEH